MRTCQVGCPRIYSKIGVCAGARSQSRLLRHPFQLLLPQVGAQRTYPAAPHRSVRPWCAPAPAPQAHGSRARSAGPQVVADASPEHDEPGRVSLETYRAAARGGLVLALRRGVSGVPGPQGLRLPPCGLCLGRAAADARRRHARAAWLRQPVHSGQSWHVQWVRGPRVTLGTARDAAVPLPSGPVHLRWAPWIRTQTVSGYQWCLSAPMQRPDKHWHRTRICSIVKDRLSMPTAARDTIWAFRPDGLLKWSCM